MEISWEVRRVNHIIWTKALWDSYGKPQLLTCTFESVCNHSEFLSCSLCLIWREMAETFITTCGGGEKIQGKTGVMWRRCSPNISSTTQKHMCLMRWKSRPGMNLEQGLSPTWSLATLERTVSRTLIETVTYGWIWYKDKLMKTLATVSSVNCFTFDLYCKATKASQREFVVIPAQTEPNLSHTCIHCHFSSSFWCIQSPPMLPLTCGCQRLTAPKQTSTGSLWTQTLSRGSLRNTE